LTGKEHKGIAKSATKIWGCCRRSRRWTWQFCGWGFRWTAKPRF